MAKDYNVVPDKASGDQFTEEMWDDYIKTNLNNHRRPPMCRVSLNANQSIANNTTKDVLWNTEVFDTDEMFSASSTTITVKTAGLYVVNAGVVFAPNATGQRHLKMTKNAAADAETPVIGGMFSAAGTTAVANMLNATSIVECAVNDTLKVNVAQMSGGALNVLNDGATFFSVTWLGQVS